MRALDLVGVKLVSRIMQAQSISIMADGLRPCRRVAGMGSSIGIGKRRRYSQFPTICCANAAVLSVMGRSDCFLAAFLVITGPPAKWDGGSSQSKWQFCWVVTRNANEVGHKIPCLLSLRQLSASALAKLGILLPIL